MEENRPLQRAIDAAGSQQRLAEFLGIRSASISEWKARGRVPAERVLAVEEASGVSRHDLRPDVFGPAPEARAEPAAPASRPGASHMTKRALREKLHLSNDGQLAKVLKLPVEQVEGWADEEMVPALPQVMKLLGHPEQQEPAQPANEDPDESRIVPVEVA